jgi:hypothetical protein
VPRLRDNMAVPGGTRAAITRLLAPAGLVVLALVAGGCTRSTEPEGAATAPAPPTSTTAAPAKLTPDPDVASWPAFTSAAGGYRLHYPPGWKARASSGSGGPVLSLLPPEGMGISVLVTSTMPPEASVATPTTRCQPVRVGRLKGIRCQDTDTKVVSTVLQGRERWYVLTTSMQRPVPPAGAYDQVLASFRLT